MADPPSTTSSTTTTSNTSTLTRKRSPIWCHFTIDDTNSRFAICKHCCKQISRGGKTTKTFNTTNLVGHLKTEHGAASGPFKKYSEDMESAKAAKVNDKSHLKQLSLPEAMERRKKWGMHDSRSEHIHRRLGEMIAIDCQPYSIVEDVGFSKFVDTLEPRYPLPSRKFFTENVIPRIEAGIKTEVCEKLENVEHLSFTTDAWTANCSNKSLLSVTAHWVSDAFTRESCILNVLTLESSHTGAYICGKLRESLTNWKIEDQRVHGFVRDNGSNMVKAINDCGFTSISCLAHTLQLVVHDGVLSQKAVIDLLAVCRKIVGHFKHSSLAFSNLTKIQVNLGLPNHTLKQDVETRWNSKYYMLQSILEQKMALAAYATEYSNVPQLSPHQLDLSSKVLQVLAPVEAITQVISAEVCPISVEIPLVRGLMKTLEKHNNDSGVRSMKKEMLLSLKRRFANMEDKEELVLATILDPRYKQNFFSNSTKAVDLLKDKYTLLTSTSPSIDPSPSREKYNSDLWTSVTEVLEESGVSSNSSTGDSSEVGCYLNEPLIHIQQGNPYDYWKDNNPKYPILAKLAKKYLSAPPTSVSSERLFSSAGEIYDDKRSRLSTSHAETLLFIKYNFHLIKGQYNF